MNREYFTDNLSIEDIAEMTDKMLRFEKNNKNGNIKINLFKLVPAVAAAALVFGLMNFLPAVNIKTAEPENGSVPNPAAVVTRERPEEIETEVEVEDEVEIETDIPRPEIEVYLLLFEDADTTWVTKEEFKEIYENQISNVYKFLEYPGDREAGEYDDKVFLVGAFWFDRYLDETETAEWLKENCEFEIVNGKIVKVDYLPAKTHN